MTDKGVKEKIPFKAEVAKVLDIVIHSLYSHREVFLRELISNASDAMDKHHFLTLGESGIEKPEKPYAVEIIPNKEKKTLTLRDNGIGMNHEDVVQNLGTIAASGTQAFLQKIKEDKENLGLIGQFGVGFYSAFMVAETVTVETKKAGEDTDAVKWISDAVEGYTIEASEKKEAGTEVVLSLREDALQYLEDYEIQSIVKKYSDYVSYPIELQKEKGEKETLNKSVAIWRRSKSEVKEEEYEEFYKYISHDTEKPFLTVHHSIEGKLEFKMLVFIPGKAPFKIFQEDQRSLRLHVKKMFISDKVKELLPLYLRFLSGVVDSEDLPLNISRETLQQDVVIPKIKKQITKKVLDALEELAKNNPGEYLKFFAEFGSVLKEGLTEDFENRDKILSLVRFRSTASKDEKDWCSLEDYAGRMQKNQKEIYYLTGPNYASCLKSPHLEMFKKKGIEVLLFCDLVDEWILPSLGEFKGKKLKSVSQGEMDSESFKEEKDNLEKKKEEFNLLSDRIRSVLQDRVKEVRLSARLDESPSCLVADSAGPDLHLEQILKSMGKEVPENKGILEVNPEHGLIQKIKAALDKDPKDTRVESWAELLYHQAVLREGRGLEDPSAFIKHLNQVLEGSL